MSKFDIISLLDKLFDNIVFVFQTVFFVGIILMSYKFYPKINDPILPFFAAFAFCSFLVLNTKKNNKCHDLFLYLLLFIICIPFLSLIVELAVHHTIFLIVIIVLASVLSMFYICWEKCRNEGWYRGLIFCRLSVLATQITIILFSLGSYIFVLYCHNFGMTALSALGCIELACLLYDRLKQISKSSIHVFSPLSVSRDILYLRSFDTDSEYKHHLSEIIFFANKVDRSVFCVGKPETFMKAVSSLRTIYLPTTNWKKAVHNYVRKMSAVVINFGSTNGIVWEIIQHQQYKDKIIYCVDQKEDIRNFIDFLENNVFNELSLEEKFILSEILTSFKIVYNHVHLDNSTACIYFKIKDQSIFLAESFEKIFTEECEIIAG